jgi:hypothetical protein
MRNPIKLLFRILPKSRHKLKRGCPSESSESQETNEASPASSAASEVCFIHIPKTAGTFVGQLETNQETVVYPITFLGHVTIVDENWELFWDLPAPYSSNGALPIESVRGKITFANVRNIFSFLVSYAHHAGGSNPKYRDKHHYDFSNANRGFEYLVKTIADRDFLWPSRKFIHYQLFAQPSGALIVDWINRTSLLDQDLPEMARRYGLSHRSRDSQRVSVKSDYRLFYTDKLISLVYQTWAREIELFGFDFDGTSPVIGDGWMIDKIRSTNYVLRTDRLSREQDHVGDSHGQLASEHVMHGGAADFRLRAVEPGAGDLS